MRYDHEEQMKTTGARIRTCRKELGLTQPELLKKLYMASTSTATMRSYERGDCLPSLETLYRMAEVFECDVEYLTGKSPTKRRETADVCQQTGLSPEAVLALQKYREFPKWVESLNILLCAENLPSILARLSTFEKKAAQLPAAEQRRQEAFATAPILDDRLEVRNVTRQYTEAEDEANDLETSVERLEYQLDTWFRRILQDVKEEAHNGQHFTNGR